MSLKKKQTLVFKFLPWRIWSFCLLMFPDYDRDEGEIPIPGFDYDEGIHNIEFNDEAAISHYIELSFLRVLMNEKFCVFVKFNTNSQGGPVVNQKFRRAKATIIDMHLTLTLYNNVPVTSTTGTLCLHDCWNRGLVTVIVVPQQALYRRDDEDYDFFFYDCLSDFFVIADSRCFYLKNGALKAMIE